MRELHIGLCVILCAIFASECMANSPDEIFGNMTYIIGDKERSQEVTLVDGKYRDTPKHPLLCVYYGGDFVYGDFNNDGLRDAAVVITESGGGSANWLSLAFLINDGEKLIHRSSYDLGYKPDIVSLTEEDGKVVVDMLVRDENTWAEGIMKPVKNIYEYTGPTAWGQDPLFPSLASEKQQ